MGNSEVVGGNHATITATLRSLIILSPNVTFVGGPGLFGSAKQATDIFQHQNER